MVRSGSKVIFVVLGLWAAVNAVGTIIFLISGGAPSSTSELLIEKDSGLFVFNFFTHFVAAFVFMWLAAFLVDWLEPDGSSTLVMLAFGVFFWLFIAWGLPAFGANQPFDLWADFEGGTLVKTEGSFILPWTKTRVIPFTDIQEVEGMFVGQGTYAYGRFYTYDLDVITSGGDRIGVLRGVQQTPQDGIPVEAKAFAACLANVSNANVNLGVRVIK